MTNIMRSLDQEGRMDSMPKAEKPEKVYEVRAHKDGLLMVRAKSKAEARRKFEAGEGIVTHVSPWSIEVSSVREK